jgi:hypothetical protein
MLYLTLPFPPSCEAARIPLNPATEQADELFASLFVMIDIEAIFLHDKLKPRTWNLLPRLKLSMGYVDLV